MNFMFLWQEQYLTPSLRSLVRYCSCHSNIKSIFSRHRVISSIYQKKKNSLFYNCCHTRKFWTDFASYLLSKHQIHLSLKDVLFGILSEKFPSLDLLNYFIIIGKLFLWDCRRSQTPPKIKGFKAKINIKYEIESKITKKEYFNMVVRHGSKTYIY